MGRRVTIDDIARQSNASASTVSLVLRNKPGIGAETRERVLATARALGYQGRPPAPVESGQGVLTVGLVLRARSQSRDVRLPIVNGFYSWVVTGIDLAARERRVNLLYATLPVDDENRPLDLPRHLLDQPLDGLLLVGAFAEGTVGEVVGARALPTVLVDACAGAHDCDAVVSDNRGGARAAVTHLLQRGHRHIALAGPGRRTDVNFRERRDGFLQALREHGLAERADEDSQGAAESVAEAVAALLRRRPELTAIFGCNDEFAIAALQAARALGRRVPEDLSIIGFDDIERAMQTTPPLTTMAVDKVSMGRLAVQALAHRLAWPDATTTLTVLRPRLMERGSVAAPDQPSTPVGAGGARDW